MTKYYIYTRVSTTKQEHYSDSLENQIFTCKDYIHLEYREKTKRGLIASRRCGTRTHQPAIGYVRDPLNSSKVHILDNSNSIVVSNVLMRLENGDFQSKTEVLEYLKVSKLYRTQIGRQYVYKLELVDRILSNLSYYAGLIDVYGDGREFAKGLHKPLIDKQQYEKIKFNTANFGRNCTSKSAIHKYSFSGLLDCEHCGARMYVSAPTSKGRSYAIHFSAES